MAAKIVGVHRSTASRWLHSSKIKSRLTGAEWDMLASGLEVVQGRYALPTARGAAEWRRIRGHEYLQHLPGNWEEPEESRVLRSMSFVLLDMFLHAGAVASIVVGDPGPLSFASFSPLRDEGVAALEKGGLLGRPRKRRRFKHWLVFEQLGDLQLASFLITTRTRVVGAAQAFFPWMPPMTLRLGFDEIRISGSRILVPVPSAKRTFHRTPLDFPLELDFGDH